LLWGVALPVGLLLVWLASPWSGREYGINYRPSGLLIYVPVAVAVVWGLWLAGTSAAARRARQVGMSAPGRRSWWQLWVWPVWIVAATVGLAWATQQVVRTSDCDRAWIGESIDPFALPGLSGLILAGGFGAVLSEAAYLRGLGGQRWAFSRAIGWGLLAGGLLLLVVGVPVGLTVDRVDRGFMFGLVVAVAVGVGALAAVLRLASRPGPTVWFARSAVRSLPVVFVAAAVVLAATVGPWIDARERAAAQRIVEANSLLLDHEVEASDARALRAYLAGQAIAAPRMGVRSRAEVGVREPSH
jgi:hypothetical protein